MTSTTGLGLAAAVMNLLAVSAAARPTHGGGGGGELASSGRKLASHPPTPSLALQCAAACTAVLLVLDQPMAQQQRSDWTDRTIIAAGLVSAACALATAVRQVRAELCTRSASAGLGLPSCLRLAQGYFRLPWL